MNINFWERDELIEGISRLYGIKENQLVGFVENDEIDKDSIVGSFLQFFDIDPALIEVSNITVTCKHITTNNDELESLKKYGLVDLKVNLSENTEINKFLYEQGICIDVKNRIFKYNEHEITIPIYGEECSWCFYGKCIHDKRLWNNKPDITHQTIYCDYRKDMSRISTKLYHDKCELECFVIEDYHEMQRYSCITRMPEIFETIEGVVSKIFKEGLGLEKQWKKKGNTRCYVLSFNINIQELECILEGTKYESTFYSQLKKYSVDSFENNEQNFYGNIFILQTALSVLCNNHPSVYGQIKPGNKIEYNDLEIQELN